METNKVASISEWPISNIVMKLRGLIGIVGYHRYLIQNFGKITAL